MAKRDSTASFTNPMVSKISMLFAAICMGNVGLFVSLLQQYPIYTIVLLRGIFGTLFLFIFMIKSHSLSKEFLKDSFLSHWKLLLINGFAYPFVIFFYFSSIAISGYAIAAFLLYTSGIFFLFFLIFTKEENVSKANIICFVLAIIGTAIIMEFWNGNVFTNGVIFGLLSGLAYGIFIFTKKKIYNQRIKQNLTMEMKGNFDIFLTFWATPFLIFSFLPLGFIDLFRLTLIDCIYSILLGFIPTALAFTLYNIGMKNDKGGNIVLISYFEPFMATINTAIFLHNLSFFTIIGGSLILIANIIILKASPSKR